MELTSLQSKMEADLEEMVTCAICTCRLKNPKHLRCQHAFCAHCLEEWVASPSNANSGQVPCPSCRHTTALPQEGVHSLPADFNKNVLLEMLATPVKSDLGRPVNSETCSICWLSRGESELAVSFCSDCEEFLCSVCLGNHNSEPVLKDHCVILGLTDDIQANAYVCSVHIGKKLAFFCPACKQLICSVCLRTSHLGHGAQNLNEAAEEKKESLNELIGLIEKMVHRVETACQLTSRAQVEDMIQRLGKEIHDHAKNAKMAVDQWLAQASIDLQKRKEVLYQKIERKTEYLTMVTSLQSYYNERLSDSDPRRILTDFDELVSRAQPLLKLEDSTFNIPKWSFVPLVWPTRLGYLEKEGTTYPSLHRCRRVSLGANLDDSKRPLSRVSSVEDPMRPAGSTTARTGSAEQETSQVLMEIRDLLNPRAIPDTPSSLCGIVNGNFKVRAIERWAVASNDGENHISSASDVILGPEDWLLVADPTRGRVQRLWFDGSGRLPETVLQDTTPRRLALSKDGSLAVTDQGYVHMLAIKPQSVSTRPKWTPLEMVQPFAVGFAEETQEIVMTDMHDRTVVIYDENLRHIRSFGGPEMFGSPNCICSDQYGRVLISDQTKNNVQAFTLSGELLWRIDHFKSHQLLVAPSGVTVDNRGKIYVGCLDGRVGVFNWDGRFICHLVDQFESVGSVRGVSCRSCSDRTLVGVCGGTCSEQSMVRVWSVPNVSLLPEVSIDPLQIQGSSLYTEDVNPRIDTL